MTKTSKYLSGLLGGALALGMWSCSANDYFLPEPDVTSQELVEGVAFTVKHDSQNPNIIQLTSLMPASYQVAWETPQGRKNGGEATLSIPFDGDYQIRMGVNTRGGYVWSEPFTFTIDDFCAEFVDNYLWTRLSGGVGNSKTWQLDLGVLDDGSTKVTFWKGPHYFFTPGYTWNNLHSASETENSYSNYMDADPWDATTAIEPKDDWYWAADYPSNGWVCSAQNYGYITFDLIGGANVTVTDADGNVVSKGTYMLDPDAHTLTLSDCYPLESTNNGSTHMRNFDILYLSDTALQLLPQVSADATSLNYVTKDYFDNWTAPVPDGIQLPEGWLDAFNTQNRYSSWKLSGNAPVNWYESYGEARTNYGPGEAYPSNLTPDSKTVNNFKLDFDAPELGSYTVTLPDGGSVTGNYTVTAKGVVTFENGIGNSSLAGSNTLSADSENSLQVISVESDNLGRLESITLGRAEKDADGKVSQYIGYRFVADYGTEVVKNYNAKLCFNNTSDWTMVAGDAVVVKGDGVYTAKVNATWTDGDPLVWLDVYNVLGDCPNFDVKITGLRVDGVDISVDDSAISRSPGDNAVDARRYICNAWGLASCFPSLDIFKPKNDIEVDFQVAYDNGKPFGE